LNFFNPETKNILIHSETNVIFQKMPELIALKFSFKFQMKNEKEEKEEEKEEKEEEEERC
jgi:hypothetical protein